MKANKIINLKTILGTGILFFILAGIFFALGGGSATTELSDLLINTTGRIVSTGDIESGGNVNASAFYDDGVQISAVPDSDKNVNSSNFWDNLNSPLDFSAARFSSDVNVSGDLDVDSGTLYVNSSSNRVGIGTTSPSSALHVESSSADPIARLNGNTSSGWITWKYYRQGNVKSSIGVSRLSQYGGNALSFATYDGNWHDSLVIESGADTGTMYLDKNGNVGIGTTSPQGELHIEGAGTQTIIGHDTGGKSYALHAGGAGTVWDYDDTGYFAVRKNSASTITSGGTAGATEIIRFQSDGDIEIMNGNVGIGTTSPGYPLQVNGSTSGISILAEKNISAEGYNTRTSAYNPKKGKALGWVKNFTHYKKGGKIDHSKFYGYTKWNQTDFSKPVNITYECNKTIQEEKLNLTTNETYTVEKVILTNCTKTTYPYEKTVEGVNLNEEVDMLRQAVFELKKENEMIKAELCKKGPSYSWCP